LIIQDLVISVGSVGFSLALLPTVFSQNKPSWYTSLITSIILAAYIWSFATLGLTYSATTTTITCALWVILLYQKLRR